MAPTQAFLDAWDGSKHDSSRSARVLLKLSLKDAGNIESDYFFASAHTSTPAGSVGGVSYQEQAWGAAILDCTGVHAPGGLAYNDVGLASSDITLDASFVDQSGQSIKQLTSSGYWIGARASIFLWETSLLSFSDALPVLLNGVVQKADFEVDRVTVSIRQRVDWNIPVAANRVTRDEFSVAPEESLGAPIPVRLGDQPAPKMRFPWPNPYNNAHSSQSFSGLGELAKNGSIAMLGGYLSEPSVLVDSGRVPYAAKAKIVVAGHKLSGLCDIPNGYAAYVVGDNNLHPILVQPTEVFNTDTEAGFYIKDNDGSAVYTMRPQSLGYAGTSPASSTIVENGRPVLDATNDTLYVSLTPTRPNLGVLFDAGAKFGTAVEYGVAVEHLVAPGTDVQVRAIAESVYTGQTYAAGVIFSLPTGTTPSVTVVPFSTTMWNSNHSASVPSTAWPVSPSIQFQLMSGTGAARIYACAMYARIIPSQTVVEEGRAVNTYRLPGRGQKDGPNRPYPVTIQTPPSTELTGKFYANVGGHPDDSLGTYSGVANACVSRPTDIMRLLLQKFAGEPQSKFVYGSGEFGSFVDARNYAKTWNGKDIVVGMSITDDTDIATALSYLMASSLSWCTLSPYDDKWRVVPQKLGMAKTWTRGDIRVDQLTSIPKVSVAPESRVATNIRMPYAYDQLSGGYKSEVSVSTSSSMSGRDLHSMRHESLDVYTGVNDTIDIRKSGVGGATVSHVLNSGEKDYALVTDDVLRISATSVHGYKWECAFGGVVDITCDSICWGGGSFFGVWKIPHGKYSMEELADMFSLEMSSKTGRTITCSYYRTAPAVLGPSYNNRFAWHYDNPILSSTNPLRIYTGDPRTNGSVLFGLTKGATYQTFDPGYSTPTMFSNVGQYAVEEELFAISASGPFDLLFKTGPNGYDAALNRSAANLLGFPHGIDYIATTAGPTAYVGRCPKNTREKSLRAISSRYLNNSGSGPSRRAVTLEGRAVYDGNTAREIVSRTVDLFSRTPVEVSFSAEGIIGIERGMVFEFAADLDSLMPYPDPGTDGSWAGKRFMVEEVEQRCGPASFDTAIVAVSV